MYELTQEQQEAIEKFSNAVSEIFDKIEVVAKALNEWIKNVISKVREALINLKNYIMELPPRQRYKYLKSIGINNYLPFFRRGGITHCRNNC